MPHPMLILPAACTQRDMQDKMSAVPEVRGMERLHLNALYFGLVVEATELPK